MATFDPVDYDSPLDPAEPQASRRRVIILWLAVLGFAILIVPLYLAALTISSDTDSLAAELQPVLLTLTSVGTPEPQVQELVETLAQINQSQREIEAAYPTLVANHTDWRAVMAAIGNHDQARLTLSSITQSGQRITLAGRAADDSVVVAYSRGLEASGLFARVVVESIKIIATPAVQPTGTAETPGATADGGDTGDATPTPTGDVPPTPSPEPHDKFEVDDFQPRDISMGETQAHNFFPIFDVDQVKFLAKAGRYYRVYTSDLALGVDTVLEVTVGATFYSNDDRQPGNLASEILFQMGNERDVDTVVRVTNRGQSAPDKWYQLTVEEILPTPTPTVTTTPLPTTTGTPTVTPVVPNTATPTATPVPPSTATPTPDLRDAFEPDDADPSPIAMGEMQVRNFYPAGDVDLASAIVKAGRQYRALTSGLALGVDTFLEVQVGNQIYQNDDYDVPGSGNFASVVCFDTAADGSVLVTITQRSGQYAPDKTYNVSVSEAPVLDVAPLTLNFGSFEVGEENPSSKAINVVSVGEEAVTWTADTDANWLSVDPTSGIGQSIVQISIDLNGLGSGSYQGNISVSGTTLCTQNTPVTIAVTMDVIQPATSRVSGLAAMAAGQALAGYAPISFVMHENQRASSLVFERELVSVDTVEFVLMLELK